jgi:hypothetical protein
MSASSISRAANDPQLQARVTAQAHKEIAFNATLADTSFGRSLSAGYATMSALYWAVAVDAELAYETAVNSGRGAPGYDTDIVTDANITAAINAHWPADVPPPGPPVVA